MLERFAYNFQFSLMPFGQSRDRRALQRPAALNDENLLGVIEELVQDVGTVGGEEHLALVWRFAQREFLEHLHDLANELGMHAVLRFFKSDDGGNAIQIKQRSDGQQPQHAVAHLLAVEDDRLPVAFVQAKGLPAPSAAALN